jgi:adenylate kinase
LQYDPSQKDTLKETLLGCAAVVWDVTVPDQIDGCSWAVEMLRDEMEAFNESKLFLCVSTVLTWAKTKSADPEDAEAPVLEEEYRRRRPHNRFKTHCDLEKLVIQCGRKTKGKFTTYVTASGLTYGAGENVFHSLFKAAWHQNPAAMPVFGQGTNVLPTIHIHDLAGVVLNVIESKPETKYLLAMDESRSTLLELSTTIAEALGTGKVATMTAEDGVAQGMVTQQELDLLTLDLRLEPVACKDMAIPWKGQTGLIESILPVVAEYKAARSLQPVKICILGPPGSGKTPYAENLCQHYKLHHIFKQGVIDEAIAKLETSAARLKAADAESLTSEDQSQAEEDRDLLENLATAVRESPSGEYEPEQIFTWFKAKLRSMACLNQGYVLDGYPETEEEAKAIFIAADDAEDPDAPDPLTVPEFVFALDATDEFLMSRVRELPEAFAVAQGMTEDALTDRLKDYREKNTLDKTVLNYFDFREVHPVYADVEGLDGFIETPKTMPIDFNILNDGEVFKKFTGVVGDAHNYGPTPEEAFLLTQLADKKAAVDAELEAMLEGERSEQAAKTNATDQRKWDASLKLVKEQAAEAMEASASPLRTFLVRHVMPTLTEGLVEVSKTRPDDPVDFLAEYLFRHNPTPQIN